jgi:hypothetical protein
MESVQSGVWSAAGQPDVIVLYGGKLRDDPNHYGPWVQWKFPWQPDDERITTIVFEFQEMLKAGGYKLKEAREPGEMTFAGRDESFK